MIDPNIDMAVYATVNGCGTKATINKGKGKGKTLELQGRYYDTKFTPGKRIRARLKFSICNNQYWLSYATKDEVTL